jgi:hypothetical protein
MTFMLIKALNCLSIIVASLALIRRHVWYDMALLAATDVSPGA